MGEELCGRDLRAALDLLGVLGEADGPAAFVTASLEGLQALIPCDWAVYNELHDGQPAVNVALPVRPYTADECELLAAYQDTHPIIAHYRATGDATAGRFSDHVSQRQLRELPIYRELLVFVGAEHQLSAPVWAAPGELVGFSLNRARGDFTGRDRLLLELLRPHLGRLLVAARDRMAMRAVAAAMTAAVPAVVDEWRLTGREHQALQLVAEGLSNQLVGRRLGISLLTVKKHLEHAYAKLGVDSRTAAALAFAAAHSQGSCAACSPDSVPRSTTAQRQVAVA